MPIFLGFIIEVFNLQLFFAFQTHYPFYHQFIDFFTLVCWHLNRFLWFFIQLALWAKELLSFKRLVNLSLDCFRQLMEFFLIGLQALLASFLFCHNELQTFSYFRYSTLVALWPLLHRITYPIFMQRLWWIRWYFTWDFFLRLRSF